MKYTFRFLYAVIMTIMWLIARIFFHFVWLIWNLKIYKEKNWSWKNSRDSDDNDFVLGLGEHHYIYRTYIHALWNIKKDTFNFKFRKYEN